MSGWWTVFALLGSVALIVGCWAWKIRLDYHAEIRRIDSRVRLSEEESRRFDVLVVLVRDNLELAEELRRCRTTETSPGNSDAPTGPVSAVAGYKHGR